MKHFDEHSQKHQKEIWRLLLMNDYEFYHTLKFIQYCNEAKIISFDLFSHIIHLLQFLDVVVFQSLKYWHSKTMKKIMTTKNETFNKLKFLHVFKKFQMQILKNSIIRKAWKEVEFISFNFDIVFAKLFLNARYEKYERRISSRRQEFISSDFDDSYIEYALKTLKNRSQLQRAACQLKRCTLISSRLSKFIKEVMTKISTEQLIEQQLTTIQAIENSRKLWANQKRWIIQKKRVISIRETRSMMTRKKKKKNRLQIDRDLKKLQQQKRVWQSVMRELQSKVSYFIFEKSYELKR